MKKNIGCMLLSASFSLAVVAHAEKEAPKIENQSKESKELQNKSPVAIEQADLEAKTSDNAPTRSPSTIDESYNSPISHSLEPINSKEYAEFVEVFTTGDKTSAPVKE